MKVDHDIGLRAFQSGLDHFWELAAGKAALLGKAYDRGKGSPVFTIEGTYTSRGWTEWTQGFQFGIPLLIFGATENQEMLELGREGTFTRMAHHVTHTGVHDHGFNNISTYGNLLRYAERGLFNASREEKEFYRLAIGTSGAVQAGRWTRISGGGFIHSFNGPHSLFIDTMRTLRILLAAKRIGHRMLTENDREIDLLERALTHALITAKYAVYYGKGRDIYDVRGRVAHESIFNPTDGSYRCPGTQQGYSGFSTWTRGLAWAMLGFTELLEFLETEPEFEGKAGAVDSFIEAARATCDFYVGASASDGIPYWDTGAPGLEKLGDYLSRPAKPCNEFEPVDSSAAAIGAQGLIRLGKYLEKGDPESSKYYFQAGLTILRTLLSPDYLVSDPGHQGILRHAIYHRPNGWDHVPEGHRIPCGESAMWGDYHMTELCYTVHRLIDGDHYTFFENLQSH